MVLNHEEIISNNIIDPNDYSDKELGNASYDLTIDKIIDMSNNSLEYFTLKPQGMIYVIFKEKIKLPIDIIGFAHVKTSLTRLGIMATNIGIIDPEYEGYISTLLINFGNTDHPISKGDPGLRVTFSKLITPKVPKPSKHPNLNKEAYILSINKNICRLDSKFLNLNAIETEVDKNVKKSVFDYFLKFGIFFTIGSFLVASIFQIEACDKRHTDKIIQGYEAELKANQALNAKLSEKLLMYDYKLISLEQKIINNKPSNK